MVLNFIINIRFHFQLLTANGFQYVPFHITHNLFLSRLQNYLSNSNKFLITKFPKNESTPYKNTASISVATETKIVSCCKVAQLGHVTWYWNSLNDSFMYFVNFITCFYLLLHGHKDSNPDQRFWRPRY